MFLETRLGGGRNELTVRSDGLAATLLPAEAPEALARRLASLDRPVPATRLAGFAPYADGNHSIIAVRLDGQAQAATGRGQGHTPALLLDFPTPEPWFPLRASVGGGSTRVHLLLAGWWTQGILRGRSTPTWQADWLDRRDASSEVPEGIADVYQWLGFSHAKPPPHLTAVDLHLVEDKNFAQDLIFTPDRRAVLQRSLRLLAIPSNLWFLGCWVALLLVGAACGALLSRLLLGWTRWGLLAGASMAIGGSFAALLAAQHWATSRAGRPEDCPQPLVLFGKINVLVALAQFLVFGLFSIATMEGLATGILLFAALWALYALTWIWWGRRDRSGSPAATRRALAAWAHAAPTATIAVLCALCAGAMAWLKVD